MRDMNTGPIPTCCSHFPKCQCPIGTTRDVARALQHASERDLNDNHYRFIPRGALLDILNHERVQDLLGKSLGYVGEEGSRLAEYISPSHGICHCQDELCTGSRVIFAALILIGREKLIEAFKATNPRFCDNDLPSQTQTPNLRMDLQMPDVFENPKDGELFLHWQWQMRSPYFKRMSKDDEGYKEFVEEVTLPWTEAEEKTEAEAENSDSRDGEFTSVQRIKIHPDHHSLGNGHDDFALKIFKEHQAGGLSKDIFKREIKANQKAPIHDRIVPLLAAFKYRGKFYLIFPWAHSGNLLEVWERHSPLDNSNDKLSTNNPTDWLLGECFGLADSLATTHRLGTAGQVAQVHVDIKPENILCFESIEEGNTSYTLKLADFGLALPVEQGSTLKAAKIAHPKTYRPPEQDVEEIISLKYDVWCLGCVFLEFITWAVLGSPGIEDFGGRREDEGNDPQISQAKGTVKEDTFFKIVVQHPRWFDYLRFKMGYGVKTKVADKSAVTKRYSLSVTHPVSRVNCKVKEKVSSHITDLQQHERCNHILVAFLSYIRDHMLVIDVSERDDSSLVRDFLDKLRDDSKLSSRLSK
ncbi:kinase-like protein [Xylariaceae sp. FL0662B]|nr:kinase-like protein [Xylariaceae sp. FL0662B]